MIVYMHVWNNTGLGKNGSGLSTYGTHSVSHFPNTRIFHTLLSAAGVVTVTVWDCSDSRLKTADAAFVVLHCHQDEQSPLRR